MGRKSFAEIEYEKHRDRLEENLLCAEKHLLQYGNTSLGTYIVDNLSAAEAAEMLSKRMGDNITVRVSIMEGGEFHGKHYDDEIFYIAENLGKMKTNKKGQYALF
jgi:hypothetical protein